MKLNWLFVILISLGACGESQKSSRSPISENSQPSEVQSEKSDVRAQWRFCECLEAGNNLKNCESKALEMMSAESLIKEACYEHPELQTAAQDMCHCINKLHQVSLKCDELQRTFDQKFDESEQSII